MSAMREDVGEPGLRINVVKLGGAHQAVDEGGPPGPAAQADQEPGFAAQRQPSQASLYAIQHSSNDIAGYSID